MLRRDFLLATLSVASVALVPGVAGAAVGPAPFDDRAFAAAQAAGKPILVTVHADWCPTCAKQRPALDALYHTADFADLVVFNIDFDTQKALVRKFDVRTQSTLIVFRGAAEKGRLAGESDAEKIKTLLLLTKAA